MDEKKKQIPCKELNEKLESLIIPTTNLCQEGYCKKEGKVCGIGTDIDPLTNKETYKCGCFTACESLSPPNCEEGYCYPNKCGEVFDEKTGTMKCGCAEH